MIDDEEHEDGVETSGFEEEDQDQGFEDDEDFEDDDFEGFGEDSFSSRVRDNPALKFGIIGGAVVLVLAGVVLFGGGEEIDPDFDVSSKVIAGTAGEVKEAPGVKEVTPAYKKAMEEVNRARIEQAKRTGESAIPTLTGTLKGQADVIGEEEEEDPLERWRRIQAERTKARALEPLKRDRSDPAQIRAEAMQAMAEAMSGQMSAVLDTLVIPTMDRWDAPSPPEDSGDGGVGGGGDGGDDGGGGDDETYTEIIIPAGTIEYAQLLTEANTDMPGTLLAEIASGPLRGSRLLGSFSAEEDGQYLVLNFNTVVIDGESYSINAVAINPETAAPGMVTEVNNRYFSRIVLPAAAAFLSGVSEAIATPATTTTTGSGGTITTDTPELDPNEELFAGVAAATDTVVELIDERAGTISPMIRVAPGTPMGLLFVEPVEREVEMEEATDISFR